jgi:hypothetical protein
MLPFGVFYWFSPLMGDESIGNDYVTYGVDHQLALQYSLKHGSFPLYAPGFAGGGHSSAALTLGQMYHPISHIAAHLPRYWAGRVVDVNTMLRLLFIGLTQLALFILLGRLKLPLSIAFILSFITVYNMRMLDMFRYGASLENYLGFLLLASALSFDYLKPSRIRGPAFITGATYLMICGGHPQIMYLGMLGVGMITCVLPFALSAVLNEARPDRSRFFRFYLRAAIFIGVGVVLSLVYILPFFFEFIRQNTSRVERDHAWSLGYSDTWGGVLNSFFRPLYSDVHGAFGSSSIIVHVLLIPFVGMVVKGAPKVIYVLFGLSLLVFLISLGGATPLHYLFWKYVPLADSFRTPGRINLILPFLFLLMLAWFFRSGADVAFRARALSRISPVFVATIAAIAVYVVYNVWLIHIVPKPGHYIPATVNHHEFKIHETAYWTGLTALILLALFLLTVKHRIINAAIGALLCFAVIFQCGVELRNGTWMVHAMKKPTLEEIDKKMAGKLAVLGLPGFGMESPLVSEQMKHSSLETKLATFYRTYKTAPSAEAAYDIIAVKSQREATVVSDRPSKQKADCPYGVDTCRPDEITLVYASYNRLLFEVDATENGLFKAGVPFFPNWRAFVDGKSVTPVRTDGYAVGVFVEKGRRQVELRFVSLPSLMGFLFFACGLTGMAVYFSYRIKRMSLKAAVIGTGALLGFGIFFLQYQSLYTGDNLMTQYRWTSKDIREVGNLALEKKAEMSSVKSIERPYDFCAGRAVDGDMTTDCLTAPGKPNPWWQVDLGTSQKIGELVIYDGAGFSLKSRLPIKIKISSDGRKFQEAKVISEAPSEKPWRIDLGGDTTARFVRIQSDKVGVFSFKEVQVFAENKDESTPGK